MVEPRYELRIPNRFSASLWHFVSARTTITPLIVLLTSKLVHVCYSFYSSSKQALGHFLVQEQVQVFEVENMFDVVGQGLREKSKTTQHFIEETSAGGSSSHSNPHLHFHHPRKERGSERYMEPRVQSEPLRWSLSSKGKSLAFPACHSNSRRVPPRSETLASCALDLSALG